MAKKKTLRQISEELKRNMQKIADRDGVTISISSNVVNNGKEIVIAEPKKKVLNNGKI